MITDMRVVAVELKRCTCLPTVRGAVTTTGLYKKRLVKYRYETDISASGTLSNRVSPHYPPRYSCAGIGKGQVTS